jgi:hypothetical protein
MCLGKGDMFLLLLKDDLALHLAMRSMHHPNSCPATSPSVPLFRYSSYVLDRMVLVLTVCESQCIEDKPLIDHCAQALFMSRASNQPTTCFRGLLRKRLGKPMRTSRYQSYEYKLQPLDYGQS